MEKEIKQQLNDLWGKKPIQSIILNFLLKTKLIKLSMTHPKNILKVWSSFLKDQAKAYFGSDSSSKSSKSYNKQGVEPNVWAKILRYKSSENRTAKAIYEAVNAKYSRTIQAY